MGQKSNWPLLPIREGGISPRLWHGPLNHMLFSSHFLDIADPLILLVLAYQEKKKNTYVINQSPP